MSVALVLTRGKMNERLVLGKCCGKLNDRLWVSADAYREGPIDGGEAAINAAALATSSSRSVNSIPCVV